MLFDNPETGPGPLAGPRRRGRGAPARVRSAPGARVRPGSLGAGGPGSLGAPAPPTATSQKTRPTRLGRRDLLMGRVEGDEQDERPIAGPGELEGVVDDHRALRPHERADLLAVADIVARVDVRGVVLGGEPVVEAEVARRRLVAVEAAIQVPLARE